MGDCLTSGDEGRFVVGGVCCKIAAVADGARGRFGGCEMMIIITAGSPGAADA